ncbi:hypothetical protein MSPP1_003948 [Malassezia sp. CBS 17886]|nr:hypothetical protein MSPP1_003948 [Malassezia sp. CBS 17886]
MACSSRNIAVAYPQGVGSEPPTLFPLPHPRTGTPTYYALTDHTAAPLYEVLVVRPEQRVSRTWLSVPTTSGPHAQGTVAGDGSLRILSAVDPALVLLGLLGGPGGDMSRRLSPLEDLAESVADWHARARAQALGDSRTDAVWTEIKALLLDPRMGTHLQRICETDVVAAATDACLYRLDWAKVHALLDTKTDRLLADGIWESAPETLGRLVNRQVERDADAATVAAARRRAAEELIASYIPAGVEREWTEARARATRNTAPP